MDNKDFFDEEFERVEQKENDRKQNANMNDPFSAGFRQSPQQGGAATGSSHKKAWLVSLVCIGVVLCIGIGWILCAFFGGEKAPVGTTTDESYYLGVLQQVMKTIDNDLYVTGMSKYVDADGNWDQSAYNAAVAAAGTALLQSLGDQFSRLMSPEQYFAYTYGASTVSSVPSIFSGRFGVTFSEVDNVGILVGSVSTDEASYGRLYANDLVFKLSNIDGRKADALGKETALAKVMSTDVDGNEYVSFSDLGKYEVSDVLQWVRGATFHVLRNGKEVAVEVKRGEPQQTQSKQVSYVSYYFGADNTNLSTAVVDLSPVSNGVKQYDYTSGKSSYELLGLAALDEFNAANPANKIGYIALAEFSGDETANVDEQLYAALNKFKASGCKKLVLDLKGNPGGNVVYATNVAGRLAYNFANLTGVTNKSGEYKIVTLVDNKNNSESYYCNTSYSDYYGNFVASYYTDYFDVESGKTKCNIAVWTDGNSASASELVTGALLDYGSAIQMGTCTYGKGIAQTIRTLDRYKETIVLTDGTRMSMPWAVYYTVDKYYTPADVGFENNLHGKGLTPSDEFNNLASYEQLWSAACGYWK